MKRGFPVVVVVCRTLLTTLNKDCPYVQSTTLFESYASCASRPHDDGRRNSNGRNLHGYSRDALRRSKYIYVHISSPSTRCRWRTKHKFDVPCALDLRIFC